MTAAKRVIERRHVTPKWLLESEVALCPCGCVGKRGRGSHLDRTIRAAGRLLRVALGDSDLAMQDGRLQRLDPRTKILTAAAALVATAFVQHVFVLVAVYMAVLATAAASRLPIRAYAGRVWLFVPVFTGIVMLPAVLNVVTPGHIVVGLGRWFGTDVGVTAQGIAAAARVVARVATSISIVVLVTSTTPWGDLLAGLRSLGVPRIFIQVCQLAYRYLLLLAQRIEDMFLARKARSVARPGRAQRRGRRDAARSGRHVVTATMGTLFTQTYALSEEVHQAMVARGWRGEPRTLKPARPAVRDWLSIAAVAVTIAATTGLDRALGS